MTKFAEAEAEAEAEAAEKAGAVRKSALEHDQLMRELESLEDELHLLESLQTLCESEATQFTAQFSHGVEEEFERLEMMRAICEAELRGKDDDDDDDDQ